MTDKVLNGRQIAVLVANGFEEVHFTEVQRRFAGTGAQVTVISPENGLVNGWHESSWGHYFPIDKQLGDVLAADFTALVVPGGKRSIDKLAANPHARRIMTGFVDAEKKWFCSAMRLSCSPNSSALPVARSAQLPMLPRL